MTKSNIVDLDANLIHETSEARLFDFGNDDNTWIPKSQHEWFSDDCIVSMTEDIAIEKGLV